MRIEIKGYFIDKFTGADERQLANLSDDQRHILYYGNETEVLTLVADIRSRERLQRTTLLGEAALELVADTRAMIAMRNK